MSVWHEASRRLRGHRGTAAMLAGCRITVCAVWLFSSSFLQKRLLASADFSGMPNLWDCFLPIVLTVGLLFLTPLRVQTVWQLGTLSGVLDENDNGFLASCSHLWLWTRAFCLRLLSGICLVVSTAPALLLALSAKALWLRIPPEEESIFPLLTVLHLAILAFAALLLPLRICAARSALPFCFLKMPHEQAFRLFRLSFRLTARHSGSILLLRIICLPAVLFPITGVFVLPVLLTAEQLRCARSWRHMQPRRSGAFARLELHAAEADA